MQKRSTTHKDKPMPCLSAGTVKPGGVLFEAVLIIFFGLFARGGRLTIFHGALDDS